MKRTIRRTIFAMAIVALAGMAVIRAHATPGFKLTNEPLARGMNVSHGTIPLQVGTEVAMAKITVDVGGSSGWHSHPGGAIIVVQKGSLMVYRSIGSQCEIETYSEGDAFIELPGEVDQVVNTGPDEYVLYVTFPRVPEGESARIDVDDPGTCP